MVESSRCSELDWAFCDVLMAQAVSRAAADAEGHVAHLVVTGRAVRGDLLRARDRVRVARRSLNEARRRYEAVAVAELAARKAG